MRMCSTNCSYSGAWPSNTITDPRCMCAVPASSMCRKAESRPERRSGLDITGLSRLRRWASTELHRSMRRLHYRRPISRTAWRAHRDEGVPDCAGLDSGDVTNSDHAAHWDVFGSVTARTLGVMSDCLPYGRSFYSPSRLRGWGRAGDPLPGLHSRARMGRIGRCCDRNARPARVWMRACGRT